MNAQTLDAKVKSMNLADAAAMQRLIALEAEVHYDEPPAAGTHPFLVIERDSPVLLSAPHGARTFRNNGKETWHEEDEFTGAMALFLGEVGAASVIANVWRSDACDPNWHAGDRCQYKERMRALVTACRVRWVIDLHGASETSPLLGGSCIDLGTRLDRQSMDAAHRDQLRALLTAAFGDASVSLNKYAAFGSGTVTAFCQEALHVQAIQIEMKPSVRVPERRKDASCFRTLGAYRAPTENVGKMLGALTDFVRYLTRIQ